MNTKQKLFATVIVLAAAFWVYFIYRLNPSIKNKVPNVPSPTKSINETQFALKTHNFTVDKKSFAFSFKYPDPAPCNGCMDGWPYNGASSNVRGIWIMGGDKNTIDSYDLTVGVIIDKSRVTGSDPYDYNIASMAKKLGELKIGETTTFPDRYNSGTVTATNIGSGVADGVRFKKFAVKENGGDAFYAFFDFTEFDVLMTYLYNGKKFAMPDKVFESFSFKLYDNPDSGEKSSMFEKRLDGTWPWENKTK